MKIQEKLKKVEYIAKIISPYNYYSLGLLDIFYLAYYKDYSYFSLKEVRACWLDYLHDNKIVYLNSYIHIPFCEVGCSYCKYFKDTNVTDDKINKFLDTLEEYFKYFKDVFEKLRIVNLHIGGGTPSLLSAKQLNRLFKLINDYCRFDQPREIAFEINPKSINKNKLEILKENGVNRLSVGVQSLNSEVLETVERNYYDFDYIKSMMSDIRRLGFVDVTLDILLGLYKDTPTTFINTLKKTLSLRPERIHVYAVNPPRLYLQKYFGNDYNRFFSRLNKIQKVVFPMILNMLKQQDIYYCDDLSFKKKDYNIYKKIKHLIETDDGKNSRRISYSDTVKENIAMLGIGKNSRSSLNNNIIYKDINGDYLAFEPDKKSFVGHSFSKEDAMLRFFLKNFTKAKPVDLSNLSSKYGIDFIQRFEKVIDYLLENGSIELTDNILQAKFKNSKECFIGGLLFFNDKVIDNIYNNCLNKTYE